MTIEDQHIDNDTAVDGGGEDQSFDTLEEAVAALGDDEELTEEQPDAEETAEDADDTDPEGEDEEGAEDEDGDEELEDGDSAEIELDDGEKVSLTELKRGYFRHRDYTHKTEEVAQQRKSVEAAQERVTETAQSLQNAHSKLLKFVEGIIPADPPLELAQTDPSQFAYQKAVRQRAIDELKAVMATGNEIKQTVEGAGEKEMAAYREEQDSLLVKAMPSLKEPGSKAAFDAKVKKVGKEFGFSDEEIAQTADHRILRLVHYAGIGMTAERNKKNATRRVAEKPSKGTRSKAAPGKPSKNKEAMKRLSKTGSIADAMKVDFD